MEMDVANPDHREKDGSLSVRLTNALDTLKRELKAMRSQDIKLMKQLIQIHETIRKMVTDRSPCQSPLVGNRCCSRSTSVKVASFQSPLIKRTTPLVRQQSEPTYCKLGVVYENHLNSLYSSSSFDESIGSIEDCAFSSVGDVDVFTSGNLKTPKQPRIPRARSFSHNPSPDYQDLDLVADDIKYEEILRRNIRLWKLNTKENSDCVFEEQGEIEYLNSDIERMFC